MTDILSTRLGLVTYLAPTGTLSTEQEFQALKNAVKACIESLDTHIVLDMAQLKFVCSATMEVLLDINDELTLKGGWIKLTNCTALLMEIFKISGLEDYIGYMEADREERKQEGLNEEAGFKRLGDILVNKGKLDEQKVSLAIKEQKSSGKRLGRLLVDKGWVSEHDVMLAISEQMGIPYVQLRSGLFDPELIDLIPKDTLRRLRVLPLFRVRKVLSLAMNDAQAMVTIDEIEERTACQVRPILSNQDNLQKTLQGIFSGVEFSQDFIQDIDEDLELIETKVDDYEEIDNAASSNPIIALVNSIIQRAVQGGASDIHIEPSKNVLRIRFRVDGVLYQVMTPKISHHPAIVSRLKVMANLDIAERRLPQDGRLQIRTQNRDVDLRLSSLPGLYGEKIVLRVLDKSQSVLDIKKLGLADHNLKTMKNILQQSYGLVLVTGPTGSGKTTTLYAALNYMNSLEKNIVTIEDPIEYQLDVINQNQVKEAIGLSFTQMLKHILRQDPDIIMVGEIREHETAKIAVQAALTGHLVLSTLHTNDSVGVINRLIDMGIEPYLLSSALIAVVAQRLIRRVCPDCKTSYKAPAELIEQFGWQDRGNIRLLKGRGCKECYDSGYKGRLAIHEILVVEGKFQQLVMSNPSRDELKAYIEENGLKTLLHDGLEQVLAGRTTIEEVSRVLN